MSKLKSGVIWTVLGNGMNAGSQWLIIVILAQFGTLSLVGDYSLILSVVTPIFILIGLSLRAVYVSSALDIGFNVYKNLRYISINISLLLSLIMMYFITELNVGLITLIFLIWVIKGLDAMSDIYYCIPYSNHDNSIIGRAIFIRGVISIFVFLISFYILKDLHYSLTLVAISLAIRTFVYDKKFIANLSMVKSSFVAEYAATIKLVKMAAPLGLASFVVAFSNNIPKYFIEIYVGREELAIYSSIAYIITLGSLPVTALGVALRPKLFKLYKDLNYKLFSLIFIKGLLLCAVLGSGLVVISYTYGQELLTLLYGDYFLGYEYEFFVASLSSILIFLGSYSIFVLTSMGKYKEGLIFTFASVICVLFMCLYFLFKNDINIANMFIAWSIGGLVLLLSTLSIIFKLINLRNYKLCSEE